jgi:putative transcriptional regulator
MDAKPQFLSGQLLVAMPGMGDPRFARSVVFMCAHSADGAMGLIINKPAADLKFSDLLRQLKIESDGPKIEMPVMYGGPVEHARGFVLHSCDYRLREATMDVAGSYGMTATVEVLHDIARGRGPRAALMMLGYAGWGPGQLEGEIRANGWLTCPADDAIVFDCQIRRKWDEALRRIGIDPRLLAVGGGRA